MEEKIKELEKQLEELKQQLADSKKSEPVKRWRAEFGNYYNYIDAFGRVDSTKEKNYTEDDYTYNTHNYFETREGAEKHLEKIKVYYELKNLADELNGNEKIDWCNVQQTKYYIIGEIKEKCLAQDTSYLFNTFGTIYCLSDNFLDVAKDRIGVDRLKLLFEE